VVKYKVGSTQHFHVELNETHCILDEIPVVDSLKTRVTGIGRGASDTLTCKTYKAIEENEPNVIFLHYKQVNKLQQ